MAVQKDLVMKGDHGVETPVGGMMYTYAHACVAAVNAGRVFERHTPFRGKIPVLLRF